jgi:hypothetical protein
LVPKEQWALLARRFAEAVEKIVDELILGNCPLVEEQAFPLHRRLFQVETPLTAPRLLEKRASFL